MRIKQWEVTYAYQGSVLPTDQGYQEELLELLGLLAL
jgi:hypothetical protein